MIIPAILGHGVSLLGLLLVAFTRPGSQRPAAIRHRSFEYHDHRPEAQTRINLEQLPDSSSLAGVPLRILLSERSSPGALLKDTLMVRPNKSNE